MKNKTIRLTIDDFLDDNPPWLLAIVTSLQVSRLAYKLNESLCCFLRKDNNNIHQDDSFEGFLSFHWKNRIDNQEWYLFKNRAELDSTSQTGGGLFSDIKYTEQLIPGKIDAVLKIYGLSNREAVSILQKVNSITQVVVATEYLPEDKTIRQKLRY